MTTLTMPPFPENECPPQSQIDKIETQIAQLNTDMNINNIRLQHEKMKRRK